MARKYVARVFLKRPLGKEKRVESKIKPSFAFPRGPLEKAKIWLVSWLARAAG